MQVDPEKPVLVAGDPERTHEAKVASDNGIWYHNNLLDALVSLADIFRQNITFTQNQHSVVHRTNWQKS